MARQSRKLGGLATDRDLIAGVDVLVIGQRAEEVMQF